MWEINSIRTDLALEEKEKYEEDNVEIDGVIIEEERFRVLDNEKMNYIKKTLVEITSRCGAVFMGRDIGKYITLEWGDIYKERTYKEAVNDVTKEKFIKKEVSDISEIIKDELINLIKKIYVSQDKKLKNILIVGLGNKDITPDSIGPLVVQDIHVNRHIQVMYDKFFDDSNTPVIAAIAPGVMGQTGMEVSEIVKALIDSIGIDLVIVIDALAARSVHRLNRTIQITDTGIAPGSGVGNNRAALNKETLGVDIIAIGVPTVVDAYTIMYDMVSSFLQKEGCNEYEISSFVEEIKNNCMKNMIVTCTDIEEIMKDVTNIISKGINGVFDAYSYIYE